IDMEVPALAHHADRFGLGAGEGCEPRIVGSAAARAAGHAEGHEPGLLQPGRLREEGIVGRVGAGPAPLDIIDPDLVQRLGNGLLVENAEINALGLRSVAKRAVEEINAAVVHCRKVQKSRKSATVRRPPLSLSALWNPAPSTNRRLQGGSDSFAGKT